MAGDGSRPWHRPAVGARGRAAAVAAACRPAASGLRRSALGGLLAALGGLLAAALGGRCEAGDWTWIPAQGGWLPLDRLSVRAIAG